MLRAFLLFLLLAAPPALAQAMTNYSSEKYGFAFSYPAQWSLYTDVNTAFRAKGLASSADICLTPGPVKTISCQTVVYVIPAAKFAPPTTKEFLGLPVQDYTSLAKDSVWSGRFTVAFGGSPADLSTSCYTIQNGFAYLVEVRGKPGEDKNTGAFLSSFKFNAPKP